MKRMLVMAMLAIMGLKSVCAMEKQQHAPAFESSQLLPKEIIGDCAGVTSGLVLGTQKPLCPAKEQNTQKAHADEYSKSVLLCYLGNDSIFGSSISTWLDIP